MTVHFAVRDSGIGMSEDVQTNYSNPSSKPMRLPRVALAAQVLA